MRIDHPLEKFDCGGEKRSRQILWVLWRWGKSGCCFEMDEIGLCLKVDYIGEKKYIFSHEGTENRIRITCGRIGLRLFEDYSGLKQERIRAGS